MDGERPLSVLIADEEAALRSLLQMVLSRADLKVWSAASPADAIELFRQHRPDLVLTDSEFKGMDGVHLVRAVRAIDPQARCCLMAASSTVYTVAELQLLGVLDVFLKPFDDLDNFAEAIRQMASS